jgi:hypothetical protein
MRSLIIIVLALCCAAASVRIEGVWPPASLSQQVEHSVRQITTPGSLIRTLGELHRLPSTGPARRPAPAALSQSSIENPGGNDRVHFACG